MSTIFQLIRTGDYVSAIVAVLSTCFVVFCCLPVHEMAHAFVAYKLGDNTGKLKGRLSLNPLAHLDPWGTIMIFLFGIGYAKPVPVNIGRFKKPKQGMALVAIAGPVSNLIMAFISIFIAYFLQFLVLRSGQINTVMSAVLYFFSFAASVNISLAVFNLLPIPPLDGSRVLNACLPSKQYYKIMQYERYIMIGLFIVLFTGLLSGPLAFLNNLFYNILSFLPRLIFGVA